MGNRTLRQRVDEAAGQEYEKMVKLKNQVATPESLQEHSEAKERWELLESISVCTTWQEMKKQLKERGLQV